MHIENPKFKIGDKVFHITKESSVGVVIDIEYKFSNEKYLYMVAFTFDSNSLWYFGHELTDTINY